MSHSISCILVEDDLSAAQMAEGIIRDQFPKVAVVDRVSSIASAVTAIATLKPDFILLDINLKDGDAFTLLRQLEPISFKIVFVTAYDRYAVQAFKFSALDYVLKPYAPDELAEAIQKVVQELTRPDYQHQLRALLGNLDGNLDHKKLVLKNADTVHVTAVADILYVQSDNNYSSFFLSDRHKIVVAKTLKLFEEKLRGLRFFRIHQSYLVNMDHVRSFDKLNDTLLLSNSTSLPVAQSKKKLLIHYLDQLY